jgi:hypothetical protein
VIQPLPLPVLYENEKAIVYRLTNIDKPAPVTTPLPIIAIVVKGEQWKFTDTITNQTKSLPAGQHLYIEPGTSFYFASGEKNETILVLFQIK